jgi:hypothetical protein
LVNLQTGQYDPAQHPMPARYLEYCVLMQHDEEALPFPPGVHLDTLVVDSKQVQVLSTTVLGSTQEAVLAQGEPNYDLCNGHVSQAHRGYRGRQSFRGRGRGHGRIVTGTDTVTYIYIIIQPHSPFCIIVHYCQVKK